MFCSPSPPPPRKYCSTTYLLFYYKNKSPNLSSPFPNPSIKTCLYLHIITFNASRHRPFSFHTTPLKQPRSCYSWIFTSDNASVNLKNCFFWGTGSITRAVRLSNHKFHSRLQEYKSHLDTAYQCTLQTSGILHLEQINRYLTENGTHEFLFWNY